MQNKFIYIFIFLLIITSFSISGCIISFPEPDITISPPESSVDITAQTPIDPGWKPPAYDTNIKDLPSFADVIEKVYPSVVSINTETVTLDIFSQPRTQKGAGSGWILDNNNGSVYIVTNNHVVEDAKELIIETYDEKTFKTDPSSVKRDAYSDLAVIEIRNANLTPIVLGDSTKLRVGDWVIALGNPLGQGLKAKEGTVSGLKVSLSVDQGQLLSDLIEVSAPINPGNSGGPLINLAGEVVGITSAKIADIGVEGLGYAISIKTALPIISELITRGYVSRPYLGVATVTINDYIYTINQLPIDKGVVITYLDQNGPAAKAGLRRYDIITHFNNKEVLTSEELIQMIHNSSIGESVEIRYIRNQETHTAAAKLVESKP